MSQLDRSAGAACPLCGSALGGVDTPPELYPASENGHQEHELEELELHRLDLLPLGVKLGLLRDVLLEGSNPAIASGNLGSGLALIRLLVRTPLAKPLTGNLPPLEDEEAWRQLLTLVIGALGGVVGPLDYDDARQIGLGMLEEVLPAEELGEGAGDS